MRQIHAYFAITSAVVCTYRKNTFSHKTEFTLLHLNRLCVNAMRAVNKHISPHQSFQREHHIFDIGYRGFVPSERTSTIFASSEQIKFPRFPRNLYSNVPKILARRIAQ